MNHGKVEEKDKIWPLFRDPMQASSRNDLDAQSTLDPVGIGILAFHDPVQFDDRLLLLLADDLYCLAPADGNFPLGRVHLESQPGSGASGSPSGGSGGTLGGAFDTASVLAKSPGSDLADKASTAVQGAVADDFDPASYAKDPEVHTVVVSDSPVFAIPIAGTGIGALEISADFWGTWKIVADQDQDASNTKVWGKDTVQIPSPEFGTSDDLDTFEDMEGMPGTVVWRMPWKGSPPRVGFRAIVEPVRLQDGKRTPAGIGTFAWSLAAREPTTKLLDPDRFEMDAVYITGVKPEAKKAAATASQSTATAAGDGPKKDKKRKGPPPLMVTDLFSWDEIAKALPRKGRIHQRLLRSLNDLAKLGKDFRLESVDADGNGCVISTSADLSARVLQVDAFRTFAPAKGKESKSAHYHLAIPSFSEGKVEFAFSPKSLLRRVFEDRPSWGGSDITFDLHLVRGYGRSHGHVSEPFARLPADIPSDAAIHRSCPVPAASFARSFGRARATPNWDRTAHKKGVGHELSWTVEVELLGEASLWHAGEVRMRLRPKSLLAGDSGQTAWKGAEQVGGVARANFSKEGSKVHGFLETGEYVVDLEFTPKKGKASAIPSIKSGLAAAATPSVGGWAGITQSGASREVDLTPVLATPSVRVDGPHVLLSVPTTGLFTTSSAFDPKSPPTDDVAGPCRIEVTSNGQSVRESGASENRGLADPDHVLRWDMHLPAGDYDCTITPPAKVRDVSLTPVHVAFTVPAQEQP
jgi:hypothetical protein